MDAVTSQLLLGIIPLVIGIGLIYWVSRRKFYRRNVASLECFSSFEASVFVRFLERICKWLAYGLIVLAILTLWSYSRMKKDKEKQQQEVKTEQSEKDKEKQQQEAKTEQSAYR
ncbi:molybdenum ABC transporter permease [Flavobacterium sp. N3904]|uniref:molybdenum ABC transporter permease n=1 Tax=Flavobacterium sp. N3904 TaxID=2986835 RepID=UPI002223F6E1|nr:molybdenum ABC transporter permease [Flavobacterium sp. N3904]